MYISSHYTWIQTQLPQESRLHYHMTIKCAPYPKLRFNAQVRSPTQLRNEQSTLIITTIVAQLLTLKLIYKNTRCLLDLAGTLHVTTERDHDAIPKNMFH